MTFTKLATATLGGAAQITFSSIPQTYDDLAMFMGTQSNGTGYEDLISLHFDTTNNFSYQSWEWQDASSPSAANYSAPNSTGIRYWGAINGTSSLADRYFGSGMFYIVNYSSTSIGKTGIGYAGATPSGTTNRGHFAQGGGNWRVTSGLTSITLYTAYSSNFAAGSQIILYGIKRT